MKWMQRYYWTLVALFAMFVCILTYILGKGSYSTEVIAATLLTCAAVVFVVMTLYFAIEWLIKRVQR